MIFSLSFFFPPPHLSVLLYNGNAHLIPSAHCGADLIYPVGCRDHYSLSPLKKEKKSLCGSANEHTAQTVKAARISDLSGYRWTSDPVTQSNNFSVLTDKKPRTRCTLAALARVLKAGVLPHDHEYYYYYYCCC